MAFGELCWSLGWTLDDSCIFFLHTSDRVFLRFNCPSGLDPRLFCIEMLARKQRHRSACVVCGPRVVIDTNCVSGALCRTQGAVAESRLWTKSPQISSSRLKFLARKLLKLCFVWNVQSVFNIFFQNFRRTWILPGPCWLVAALTAPSLTWTLTWSHGKDTARPRVMIEKAVTRIGSLPCLHFFLLLLWAGTCRTCAGNWWKMWVQTTNGTRARSAGIHCMALAAALEAAGRLQPLEVNIWDAIFWASCIKWHANHANIHVTSCDMNGHERTWDMTWLRSLSSSCECARHRPDRRRGCLSLVQMLVSCNLGWPIGAPAACTYRIQAKKLMWEKQLWIFTNTKRKMHGFYVFFRCKHNSHTLMPCWAATGDDATDSAHPHGDLSEFEAIFADFRLAVPEVQMNLTFVFQSFAPTLLSCIDLRLHYVTSLSTLCVRPGFACDLHRFMATWKAFNSCWTARQMLWPLILLGSHFCATLFAMCCLDSSWDLNWKHRKYAEQKNEHWKLSLRRVCFEFMGSFQFHFPGPLSLFMFHSGLLYHRTPSLKWHWMAATSSISLYLLNLLSFLQTSRLHVEPKFRNLVVSDRPDLQTMFGRRRTWDFHTSSQRGCVRPCGTSTLGFWKWRGSKRWDGKNASECHKRNVWIGIAIILYHFFMWNFQIFANSHIFHPDVSCLEIPGNSARQYLRSSAYYALQRPWHPVFNMIQQCSNRSNHSTQVLFGWDCVIAWFLGWFWASGLACWRSEPEVTPEAQKLSDNFAGTLTMSPDCLLRYWWATGARGLRLCRRLFVEADTLHKIWFQVQSQNLELLEFDVAQKKEFIEYIYMRPSTQ